MEDTQEKWLAVGQVAERFGVDPRTVNRWCHTGQIEHVRTPGGRYKIAESVVQSYFGQTDDRA